jgi:F-type H+-transporting ATPase subunit c
MEGVLIVKAVAYFGAAFAIAFGCIAPAYGQGLIGSKACEKIGEFPESAKDIKNTMYIAMGIVESSAVYVLLIALLLIFFS